MKLTKSEWCQNLPWIDRDDADIEFYCNSRQENDYDLKEKLKSWKDNGLVIFENAIESNLIDELLKDIQFLMNNPQNYSIEIVDKGDRKQINNFSSTQLKDSYGLKIVSIHQISLAAKRLSLNQLIISFLGHVFQDSVCAMQSLTFNRGSQQAPHADFAFVNYQKTVNHLAASWIALEDIHPDSGPLAYYPGTHKVSEFGFYDFGEGEIVQSQNKNKAGEYGEYLANEIKRKAKEKKVFLPKKGDILIWHSALVHEGLKVNNPDLTRKSYVTHYSSAQMYPDDYIRKDSSNKKVYFESNNGIIFENPWVDKDKSLPSSKI